MSSIVVVSKPDCTECERIKSELKSRDIPYIEMNMPDMSESEQFRLRTIARQNRQMSMPMIFVDETFITTKEFEKAYLA